MAEDNSDPDRPGDNTDEIPLEEMAKRIRERADLDPKPPTDVDETGDSRIGADDGGSTADPGSMDTDTSDSHEADDESSVPLARLAEAVRQRRQTEEEGGMPSDVVAELSEGQPDEVLPGTSTSTSNYRPEMESSGVGRRSRGPRSGPVQRETGTPAVFLRGDLSTPYIALTAVAFVLALGVYVSTLTGQVPSHMWVISIPLLSAGIFGLIPVILRRSGWWQPQHLH